MSHLSKSPRLTRHHSTEWALRHPRAVQTDHPLAETVTQPPMISATTWSTTSGARSAPASACLARREPAPADSLWRKHDEVGRAGPAAHLNDRCHAAGGALLASCADALGLSVDRRGTEARISAVRAANASTKPMSWVLRVCGSRTVVVGSGFVGLLLLSGGGPQVAVRWGG